MLDRNAYFSEKEQPFFRPSNWSAGVKMFLLCIKSGECDQSKGNITHLSTGEKYIFSSLSGAILQMEQIMNHLDYPEENIPLRNFKRTGPDLFRKGHMGQLSPGIQSKSRDGTETFVITVYFRQNCSWQGEVQWVGHEKCCYRSVLELMHLINSAITEFG